VAQIKEEGSACVYGGSYFLPERFLTQAVEVHAQQRGVKREAETENASESAGSYSGSKSCGLKNTYRRNVAATENASENAVSQPALTATARVVGLKICIAEMQQKQSASELVGSYSGRKSCGLKNTYRRNVAATENVSENAVSQPALTEAARVVGLKICIAEMQQKQRTPVRTQ